MNEATYDLIPAKKAFSRTGWAMSAILALAALLQVLWFGISLGVFGEEHWLNSSSWGMWLGTFLPMYLVAFPTGFLILRKLPAHKPQDQKLSGKQFLMFVPMSLCLMYVGNLIGNTIALSLSGGSAENAVVSYAMDNNPLKILVMVIAAPILEEYLCRKQIIDRTRQYGEKTAVLLSGLVFALMHQNLFQFFYAFGLGILFAYIYVRTGRLRYPVILHCIVNFLGSVVAPWVLSGVDLAALESLDPTASPEAMGELIGQNLPGFLGYLLYAMLLMGFAAWGLILLILKAGKTVWKESDLQLPKGSAFKAVFLNGGMVVYIVLCVGMIILSLFA